MSDLISPATVSPISEAILVIGSVVVALITTRPKPAAVIPVTADDLEAAEKRAIAREEARWLQLAERLERTHRHAAQVPDLIHAIDRIAQFLELTRK